MVRQARSAGSQMLLAELLSPERVKIPLVATDKRGLIEELADLVAEVADVPEEAETIREAVLEREAVLSTGIGGGVGIPHGKTSKVGELVLVAGRTPRPVDFEALDSRPVQILMMLVGPESAAGLHIKVLSRISRLLRQEELRERLLRAEDAEGFLSVLRDAESR